LTPIKPVTCAPAVVIVMNTLTLLHYHMHSFVANSHYRLIREMIILGRFSAGSTGGGGGVGLYRSISGPVVLAIVLAI